MPVTIPRPVPTRPNPNRPTTDPEPDLPTVRVVPQRRTFIDIEDSPGWNPIEIELSRPIMLTGVGVGDPVYEGTVVANTTLVQPGRVKWRGRTKRCTMTLPQTKDGNSKSDKKVCLQRSLIKIAFEQYEIGYMVGYRVAKSLLPITVECQAVKKNSRRLNDQIKAATLSQEPSFPRKKSKTGVTRIGRKRKGPG